MKLSEIQFLFDYTKWANHLILDAAANLSEEEFMKDRGVSYQSMHGTMLHLLFAEWVWLRRFQGSSPSAPLAANDYPDLASIKKYWQQIEAKRDEFLATLSDESLEENLTYKDIAGNEHSNLRGLLLQHVVNHATLHRGQVVSMIRQLGIKPPATDFLFYFRK